MNRISKTGALLGACIITVSTLCYIQFQLVWNTYRLTKDRYYTEVKQAMSGITSQVPMQALEDSIRENLAQAATSYIGVKIGSSAFFTITNQKNKLINEQAEQYLSSKLKNQPALGKVGYQLRYDELVIVHDGKADTLLPATGRPVTIIGKAIPAADAILLNRNVSVTRTNNEDKRNGKPTHTLNLRILIKQSSYIDISNPGAEIFRRMAGTFIMAAGLILAVITLFYLVFRALIRQRKIAEMKTDFANNITHELQTPLSSVNLILKSLQRQDIQAQPALMSDLLHSLSRQHQKIQQLVDSVLESTMQAEGEIQLTEIDIAACLHEYSGDLYIANHPLIIDIESRAQRITTNNIVVLSILNILIDNATKYSAAGKPIRLSSFTAGHFFCIQVTDQGKGIASAYQQQLFDKFYRIPEANHHTVKGLGLGLYLARQSAVKIGAELLLKDSNTSGSTFELQLPL